MTRRASCSCGQLQLTCRGEPVRISVCHCFSCQQRTGSAFGAQARFARGDLTVEGKSTPYTRVADSGNSVTFHFCPQCGSTVYWEMAALEGFLAVALGAFTDPSFPEPRVAVYEARRHPWVQVAPREPMERYD